eukprot:17421-Heterococcus_DN1.PRE.4
MCLRCLIRGRAHAAAHRASLPLKAPVNVAVAALSGDSRGGMTSASAGSAPRRQKHNDRHMVVDDSQYNRLLAALRSAKRLLISRHVIDDQ